MGIQGHHAVAVVDHHIVAVAAGVVGGGGDHAGQSRTDWRAGGNGNVNSSVAPGLAGEGILAVTELGSDTALPAGADRRAEAIRPDEGRLRSWDPVLCSGGGAVAHQVVNAVGIAAVFLRNGEPGGRLDVCPHGFQVCDGNGHGIALLGLHLIALLVYGGHSPGALLIGHKAIHKLLVGPAAGYLVAEVQSIKDGLDPYGVKAGFTLGHIVDRLHVSVQERKAVLNVFHIDAILRRHIGWQSTAGEAQLEHAVVVIRRAAQDGAEGSDKQNHGSQNCHHNPPDGFASSLIRQDRSSDLGDRRNGSCHQRPPADPNSFSL